MESKQVIYDQSYDCNPGQIWIKTGDESELLFKYYDPSVKEEKDSKKIKDEQIFPKIYHTMKIKQFATVKQKQQKETQILANDTPVYLISQKQYGVIRKVLKTQKSEEQKEEIQYEVRLSTSLENVIVDPSDLKRVVTIQIRIHSFADHEAQNINIKIKVDSTVNQLLQYVAQLAQIAPNFINLYHKKKRLSNSDQLYKEGVIDGDRLLCIQGQGDLHEFIRFKTVSNSGWGFSQTNWDAISWRPNRTIMVAGFGIYGITTGQNSYLVRYKYVVNNTSSDECEQEVKNSEMNEITKIVQVMFPGDLIEVPAGTDITIQMRCYGPNQNFKLRGYYGYNGNSYKTFDNADKDLFEINYSSLSGNGTGVDSGQLPSLYYYLTG